MKKIISDKSGFSLVELIIAVAIIGVVMAMSFGIFIQASGIQNKITRKVQYQDAATNIIATIKSRIKDTNYLTLTSSDTDSAAVASSGTGRFYVKGDYDGFYFQTGTDAAVKMYGEDDLNGSKLKLYYKCEPSAIDGRYSLVTIKLAFYPSSVSDADITADLSGDKAEYVHDATIYLQNLAFGIKISDSAIEAQKATAGYDAMSDSEKETFENNMMGTNVAGFEGKCLKYRVIS